MDQLIGAQESMTTEPAQISRVIYEFVTLWSIAPFHQFNEFCSWCDRKTEKSITETLHRLILGPNQWETFYFLISIR